MQKTQTKRGEHTALPLSNLLPFTTSLPAFAVTGITPNGPLVRVRSNLIGTVICISWWLKVLRFDKGFPNHLCFFFGEFSF